MRLHILTTGGTIDKIYFDAKSDYHVGEPVIDELLQSMGVNFEFSVEPLMQKDSLDMTDQDRELIRERVISCEEKYVLITHGTDGMVATADALAGISGKHIMLTGALNPAAFSKSDAVFNIGCAVGGIQCCQPGVYIAMNGCIFPGDKVVKNVAANQFERLNR
jgi:L-asparaginase